MTIDLAERRVRALEIFYLSHESKDVFTRKADIFTLGCLHFGPRQTMSVKPRRQAG